MKTFKYFFCFVLFLLCFVYVKVILCTEKKKKKKKKKKKLLFAKINPRQI